MKGTQAMWIARMEALGESLGLTVAVDQQWANTGVVRFRRPDSFSTLAAVHYAFNDNYASFDVRDANDTEMIPKHHGVGYCVYEQRVGTSDRPFEEEVRRIENKVRETASETASETAVLTERSVPADVIRSIKEVVRYNWADERHDYETQVSDGSIKPEDSHHIFADLKRIEAWLKGSTTIR